MESPPNNLRARAPEAVIDRVKYYHQEFEVQEYWRTHCRKCSQGIFDPRCYDAEVLNAFVIWPKSFCIELYLYQIDSKPYLYCTVINFLNQNSQKLLDRY